MCEFKECKTEEEKDQEACSECLGLLKLDANK